MEDSVSGERVLVTGSRKWTGEEEYHRVATEIEALDPSLIMHGGALGADACADFWVKRPNGKFPCLVFRANWSADGRAAGPIRNARMLREGKPDRGLAFGPLWREVSEDDPRLASTFPLLAALLGPVKGWKATGTGDMVRRMLDAGLPVRWVAAADAPAVDLTEMPEVGGGSGGA